eukprot:1697405-Prorocentrum_lima.AAC.1
MRPIAPDEPGLPDNCTAPMPRATTIARNSGPKPLPVNKGDLDSIGPPEFSGSSASSYTSSAATG